MKRETYRASWQDGVSQKSTLVIGLVKVLEWKWVHKQEAPLLEVTEKTEEILQDHIDQIEISKWGKLTLKEENKK